MSASHRAIIVGVACLTTASPIAYAWQDLSVTAAPADETVLFSADRISRADDTAPVVAEGNVQAFFGDQSLAADRVTFDPNTDVVVAYGNVTVFDGQGQSYFADSVELTGDLKDGVATNFSALLGERDARLAASTVVRRSSGENDLSNGAFTACAVCTENGDTRTPTWEVRALRVTQDTENQTIRFRNAVVQVLGVPVFFTPYLEYPDPSVERKSGFLTPNVGTSSRTGLQVEVPYYWAISDHQDITFSPRHFADLGTLVKGEYRLRRHNSGVVLQAGAINPRDDSLIREDDPEDFRWHLFAQAFHELPNDWRAELDIDFVSDKSYLRTYDIQPEGELREAVDILQPDRLENELSFVRRTDQSYTDISGIMFQSLRFAEDSDFIADALPRIRHERYYDFDDVGGRLTLGGDFLFLNRRVGLDTTRAVAWASYEKSHTTQGGQRFRSFFEVRGDAYRYSDASQGVEDCNIESADYEICRLALPRDAQEDDFATTRFLPTAGLEWSYPLARFTNNATYIIEPKAQLVVSTDRDFQDDVFNEDGQFFQFDTVTLFDWTKSPGFDQWEDGQRLNVGFAGSAIYDNGLTISGEIGQQYRIADSLAFDGNSGLGDQTSDVVGTFDVGFGSRFQLENRFRIDNENGALRRGETTLRSRLGRLSTNLSYLRVENQNQITDSDTDEFLTATATYQISDRWAIGGNWRENLETNSTTAQSLLLQYRDDCTIFSLNYRFDNTTGDNFSRNRSLTFNVDVIGF